MSFILICIALVMMLDSQVKMGSLNRLLQGNFLRGKSLLFQQHWRLIWDRKYNSGLCESNKLSSNFN